MWWVVLLGSRGLHALHAPVGWSHAAPCPLAPPHVLTEELPSLPVDTVSFVAVPLVVVPAPVPLVVVLPGGAQPLVLLQGGGGGGLQVPFQRPSQPSSS